MSEVTVTSLDNLQNEVRYGDDRIFIADEPVELGGNGQGPDPYTLLLGALGSCLSMTVMLYARRKAWPLKRVTVRLSQGRIHADDCQECTDAGDAFVHRIETALTFEGDLSDQQKSRLREIAHKCPVHKTLTSPIVITDLEESPDSR
jgi:uncharacterized OsmC-like protein